MSSRRRVICTYCGPQRTRPTGYDRVGSPHECLRSGIGVGTHQERRKWQYATGRRVDPEYISPCPHLPPIVRGRRNRVRTSVPMPRSVRRSRPSRSRSRRRRMTSPTRRRNRSNTRRRYRNRSRSRSRRH